MSIFSSITMGHSEYSWYRFCKETRHVIVYDDLKEYPCTRTRYYLDDAAYALAKQREAAGWIKIIYDGEVIEGTIVEKKKKKNSTR